MRPDPNIIELTAFGFTDPMAYITRMDYARSSKCWWVRFTQKIGEKYVMISQKTFKDSGYTDGKDESLNFAQEWRDWELLRLIKEEGYLPTGKGGFRIAPSYAMNGKRANNTTGCVGITKVDYTYDKKVRRKSGISYRRTHVLGYCATWVEYDIYLGKIRRRCRNKLRSINSLGETEAYKQAYLIRLAMVERVNADSHVKLRRTYLKNKLKERRRQ